MKKLVDKTTKVCCRCNIEKPLDDFHKAAKGSLGRQGRCKFCHTIAQREYNSRKPEKIWVQNLKRMGMNPHEYNDLLHKQGGVCAACGQPETSVDNRTGNVRRLAIDHDHSCCPERRACKSCIRGLLCKACNQALGMLQENPTRLESLYKYIKQFC